MKFSLAVLSALAVLLNGVQAVALDPEQRPSGYARMSWGQENGLASGRIHSLAQDRVGYLWLATDAGLVRFDGSEFVSWPPDGDAVARVHVRVLLAARDGSIWAGGNGGVSRISGADVKTYNAGDGLLSNMVTALIEDADGVIWAGGGAGVARFASDRWLPIQEADGLPLVRVYAMNADSRGAVWVSTPKGVFVRPHGATRFAQMTNYSVMSFDAASDGQVWVADGKHGVHRIDGQGSGGPAFVGELGTALLRDRDGNLWVATAGLGVWRMRTDGEPSRPERLSSTDGAGAYERMTPMLEDREGNIWMAAGARLLRYSDNRIAEVGARQGLPETPVTAMAVTKDQRLWVATSHGLYSVNTATLGRSSARLEMAGSITALHVDSQDRVWLATVYRDVGDFEVGHLEHGRFIPLRLARDGLLSPVMAIATDAAGGVWTCSFADGLQRWNASRSERFPVTRPLDPVACRSAETDAEGRPWFGVRGGALFYENGTLHVVEHTLGAQEFGAGDTFTVHIGPSGTVWLSTPRAIARFASGRWGTVAHGAQLPGVLAAPTIEDGDGRVWTGVDAGLLQVTPSADAEGTPILRLFDEWNGLGGRLGTQWLRSQSAARTSDGRLWFATSRGIAVIDPSAVGPQRTTTVTRVDRIIADGHTLPQQASLRVPPGTTKLEVHYGALNLSTPQTTRFRYRLDEIDSEWVDAGTRRQAFYTNLAPGAYRFHVAVTDNDGNWTPEETQIALAVQPTFRQTSWFYVLLAVAVVALVGSAWWLRLRVMRARFHTILADRAHVARELHDTLLQSLGSVAVELEAVTKDLRRESPDATRAVESLRSRVTSVVREARDSIEHLRTSAALQLDLLSAMRDLVRHVKTQGMSCTMRVSGSHKRCSAAVEAQVVRVAQESINNAVRHAGARSIDIELDYADDSLLLCVSDDGCGFDTDSTASAPGHWGIAIMRERVTIVGGSFAIASDKGRGTRVEVVVPLRAEPLVA